MREGSLPIPSAIVADYKTVAEYAQEKTTAVPDDIIRKRFMKHVAAKTNPEISRHWGRDYWYAFDSLPRTLRDIVNDATNNPDNELISAIEYWASITDKAEAAMDRIVRYEHTIDRIDSLPDWLKEVSIEEIELIKRLKAERLAKYVEILAEQERQRKERERLERSNRQQKFTRYTPPTKMEYYTINGKRPEEIEEEIRLMRVPPHIARELLAAKLVTKLDIARHTYTREAGFRTYDSAKEADKIDNTPPLKFHPIQVKRGRNY